MTGHRLVWALALACACAFSFGTVASARSFSLSSQTWRATFRELRFSGFGTTICPITMEGSFHSRTVAKVIGSLIGYVTGAAMGTCQQGSATIDQTSLAWHSRYFAFIGTLPSISSVKVNVVGARIRVREPVFGITCTYTFTSERPLSLTYNREAGGALTTLSLLGRAPTDCGSEGTLEGTSTTLTVLNSASRITVTLI
jgi:hypothetical protein